MKRKLCSVLLALCMVLTLLPVSAMAEGGTASDGDALKKLFSDVKAGEASSGNVTVTLDKDYNLTDYSWTSLTVDGYHGAGIVTVEGNGHTITGLNAPLFAGGFAGTSGIVIKNLTLNKAKMSVKVEKQTGIGAFIGMVDSMTTITLDDCHLKNSEIGVEGNAWVGGFVGYTAGYNKVNDGPVDTNVSITNSSIEDCNISTTSGSIGGFIGHAGGNPATYQVVNNSKVANTKLTTGTAKDWRVGVVAGTVGVGQLSIANVESTGNTLTQTDKTLPEGQSDLYGRFVPNTTGKLVIDGVPVFNSDIIAAIGSTGYKTLAEAVAAADNATVTLLKDTTENVTIPAGATVTLDLNGKTLTNVSGHTITNNGNLTVTGSGTVDNVTNAKGALYNCVGATAILNGGTFTRSQEAGTYEPNEGNGNSWYTMQNDGTMTINAGTTVTTRLNDSGKAVGGFSSLIRNGGNAGTAPTLLINGGHFNGGINTVKNDEGGTLTIKGGDFSNTTQYVIMNWNIADIYDGTFEAQSAASAVLFSSSWNGSAGTLNFHGGNVKTTSASQKAIRDYWDKNNKGNVAVSGGIFTVNPTAYVADTHIARKDGDTKFVVVEKANLTAGVYTSDPSSALAPGYVSYKNSDNTYTVYYPVPVTPGNTSSSTTKNPDGSTTTTTTDKTTGTVTETTKNPDGSTTTVETKKDGSVTETNKTAGGSVGTVKSDANGNTEISANISAADVSAAAKKNEPVAAPVSVAPAASPAAAPVIKLSVPASAGEVSVVIPVVNAQQGTVAIKVNPDGTEEIIKTSVVTKDGVVLGVKGSTQIKIVNNDKDFLDTVGHWAESDVDFVSARELFTGTAPQTFSPEAATTRGMVVTVLARLAGESTDGGANWYDKGCAWAVTNGVSDGTDPNGTVTREQLAAMLYRYFGSPAVSGSLSFADASSVSEYAHDAMQWCVNNGIINGMDGLLNPQGQATRAQVSAMFARYIHLAATK